MRRHAPALPSMWRLCKLGYQHEPELIVAAFSLSLLSALPDALLALWFKLLGEGVLEGDWPLRARRGAGARGVRDRDVVSADRQHRVQRRFRDKVTIALESHVATLLASIATIAHQERPDYLDRLSVLRNQVFMLDHMYMSLFSTCGWILRLGVTIALLVSIHPALALLALFALPTGADVDVAACRRADCLRARRGGEPAGAALFDIATTAAPGKEVRVTGIGRSSRRATTASVGARVPPDRRRALGLGRVAYAGVGDFRRRICRRDCLRSSGHRARRPATCCWRWRRARGCRRTWARPSVKSDSCADLDGCRTAAWLARGLRRVAGHHDSDPARARPARTWHPVRSRLLCVSGHRSSRARRHQSRTACRSGRRHRWRERRGQDHPGQAAGQDVRAHSGPHPDRRRQTWPGFLLTEWRARLAGAFQDFFRFEFRARHSVGVGDLPRIDDETAVATAVTAPAPKM